MGGIAGRALRRSIQPAGRLLPWLKGPTLVMCVCIVIVGLAFIIISGSVVGSRAEYRNDNDDSNTSSGVGENSLLLGREYGCGGCRQLWQRYYVDEKCAAKRRGDSSVCEISEGYRQERLVRFTIELSESYAEADERRSGRCARVQEERR